MKISRLNTVMGIFAALLLLFALASCGEKAPSEKAKGGQEEHQHAMENVVDQEGHQHEVDPNRPKRPVKIPPAVMDSLRAKKERYHVTQDIYQDDKGGILANDYVEVHYPPGPTTVTHGMHALEQIAIAREKCREYWGMVPEDKLTVICPEEMEDFEKATGREWWNYAKIEDDRITFQPIYILYQRGLGEIAIAHEYQEWAIGKLSRGTATRILEEGLASYLSGEKDLLLAQVQNVSDEDRKMSPQQVENTLKQETKKDPSRLAYYQAYRLVAGIIHYHGDEALKLVMKRLHEGQGLDSAFQEACGKSYEETLAQAADYKLDGGS